MDFVNLRIMDFGFRLTENAKIFRGSAPDRSAPRATVVSVASLPLVRFAHFLGEEISLLLILVGGRNKPFPPKYIPLPRSGLGRVG